MSEKLKIYACSGVGAKLADAPHFAGSAKFGKTVSNTQAVNTLLAKMNGKYVSAKCLNGLTDAERIALMSEGDLLCVAAELAKKYTSNKAKLLRAGMVLATLDHVGDFECNTLDADVRNENLAVLLKDAQELTESDSALYDNPEWMQWWNLYVMSRNKVGLNASQQKIVGEALQQTSEHLSEVVKGLGEVDPEWIKNEDLAEYLQNGGKYFIYTYLTDEQIASLPAIFKKKKTIQQNLYDYCKGLFVDVFGSEAEMREIIRTSIIEYYHEEPEAIAYLVATGKAKPVSGGVTVAVVIGAKELIQLIALAATFIITIVYLICQTVYKSNVAKYSAVNKALVQDGCASEDDFSELQDRNNSIFGKGKTTDIITLALLGVGAFLVLKN